MKFHLTAQTITPLHIGTGTELLEGYDYKTVGSATYRLNADAIFLDALEQVGESNQESVLRSTPGKLVNDDNALAAPDSPYVRYALRGRPQNNHGAAAYPMREAIKTFRDAPYLPGSSIKGALRNALMAWAVRQGDYEPRAQDLGDAYYPKNAAQRWTQDVFGRDPNQDILRALQVSDARHLPGAVSPWTALNVAVFTGGRADIPIAVEAIGSKQYFEFEILIDELILQYRDQPQLKWGNRALLLVDLFEALNDFSMKRIAAEIKKGGSSAGFYAKLETAAQMVIDGGGAVVQLGWGTGHSGMTITPALSKPLQNEVRTKYSLGKPPQGAYGWQPNLSLPFPAGRRMIVDAAHPQPLGWVALTIEPQGDGGAVWHKMQAERKAELARRNPPVSTAPASAPAPAAPTVPMPTAPPAAVAPDAPKPVTAPPPQPTLPAAPAPAPVIESFSALPKVGDRFEGIVFDSEADGRTWLEIPGLSVDDVATAVLPAKENPLRKRYKAGVEIEVEVTRVGPDPDVPGMSLVVVKLAD